MLTDGNEIQRADTGEQILLRGVNRSGLEYAVPGPEGFLAAVGFEKADVVQIVSGWGANLVRIPLNQAAALPNYETNSAEDYLRALDTVIKWAASIGAWTLLDLHWLEIRTEFGHLKDGSVNHVPPLPDPESILFWRTLATRYKNEPAVLFDLFNEPHTPLPNDTNPIWIPDQAGRLREAQARIVTAQHWKRWAALLLSEIRAVNPDSLVFISGVDWGYDLRDLPLKNERNVVYSTHVYPHRRASSWDKYFGSLAAEVPVFVAEWGGEEADLAFGTKLLTYMEAKNLGWAAWSWRDWPHLLDDIHSRDYSPTAFGGLVKEALTACKLTVGKPGRPS